MYVSVCTSQQGCPGNTIAQVAESEKYINLHKMYKDEEQGCIFIDTAAAQVCSREQKTDFGAEEKVTRLRKPQREA